VGLREMAMPRLRPRWTGLDIEDFPGLVREFEARFAAHPLHREVDIFMCTTPAVLCSLLLSFDRPLLGYLGEPVLLAVDSEQYDEWWATFKRMVSNPRNFIASYNQFLSDMVEFQSGHSMPVIRLHGLYTNATYSPTRLNQVLVVKGPNICVDPACLLNRFSWTSDYFNRPKAPQDVKPSDRITFWGLDELGGAPYDVLASFRATVLYPYDVALAIFYELYSMNMPLFLPTADLLPFYVFRGLHSDKNYHHMAPYVSANESLSPFVPVFGIRQWFTAGKHWSDRTDFARFPHLLRFSTVAELLAALAPGATD